MGNALRCSQEDRAKARADPATDPATNATDPAGTSDPATDTRTYAASTEACRPSTDRPASRQASVRLLGRVGLDALASLVLASVADRHGGHTADT